MSKIVFKSGLSTADPVKEPVLIVGQLKHLKVLKFNDIKCKLQPRVTEDVSNYV